MKHDVYTHTAGGQTRKKSRKFEVKTTTTSKKQYFTRSIVVCRETQIHLWWLNSYQGDVSRLSKSQRQQLLLEKAARFHTSIFGN